MADLTKKIFRFLNNFFFSCEENEADKELLSSFERRKREILEKNRESIINRLTPAIQKTTFKYDNLLITEEQARTAAIEIFNTAKEAGDINCLNEFVQKESVR